MYNILLVCILIAVIPLETGAIDKGSFNAGSIIEKDVAILGGGAAGAHAAFRLREDLGKSIVLVEKRDHLVCLPPRS